MPQELAKVLTKTRMSFNDIREVISTIDIESANSVYRKCAEEFEFNIAQIEGSVYSVAKELATIFGYSRPDHVSRVLKQNQCETIALTGLPRNGVSLIKESLNLLERDYSTQLIDYRGFLTIALEGHGEHCDKVRQYLLATEQKARVDTVVYEKTGLDASDLSQVAPYLDDPTVKTMLESQRTMRELVKLRINQLKTDERVTQLETQTNQMRPVTSEQEHILNQKKDELVGLKSVNGMSRKRAYAWFYSTIKSRFRIGLYSGMSREKFPLAVEWIDSLIAKEKARQVQLQLL